MPRAYGANARLLLKREEAYGIKPSGSYLQMPFTKCSLGSEQGLIEEATLGYGRDPRAPLRDIIHNKGEISLISPLKRLQTFKCFFVKREGILDVSGGEIFVALESWHN